MAAIMKRAYPLEIRKISEDGHFDGYGSVFNSINAYDEYVKPGAFKASIEVKTPVMLWQHDSAEPIGVYDTVREDDKGLWLEGRVLLDVAKGREAYILLKNNAIRGLSIGFIPLKWSWEKQGDLEIRAISEIDLWEVSLVTFPADRQAGVTNVRSIETVRDCEKALREAGLSRSEANAIITACKTANQREAEAVAAQTMAEAERAQTLAAIDRCLRAMRQA